MNDERRGIEELREAIETVARDIESRPEPRRVAIRMRPLTAIAAGALLVALGLSIWYLVAPVSPAQREVEVVELKVRGRAVRAAVVEDAGGGTILVMPRADDDNDARPPVASISMGVFP